jgi:phage terminase large subunit-like protein
MKEWRGRSPQETAKAQEAVDFFRDHLTHTKGVWAGTAFAPLPWQEQRIIRPLFGTLDQTATALPDGTQPRLYRTAYVEVPRKNGKSEMAAGIALKCLFGDGEPGGEVYGAALDRDQASIVFNVAAAMVRSSPVLSKRAKILDATKRIIVTKGISAGSVYRAIPGDAGGSWGFNASAIIFDELHVQPNRELWDALTTSTGARAQPLIFGITTAGIYDPNAICWELHEYSLQVASGAIEDPTWLSVVYGTTPEDDWTDRKVWARVNPSLNATIKEETLAREVAAALRRPAYANTVKRLHLNLWTSQTTAWINMVEWAANAGRFSEKDLRGRPCYGALDLASSNDLAAFLLCFPPLVKDEPYHFVCRFWLPEEDLAERSHRDRAAYMLWAERGLISLTPGNRIKQSFIEAEIARCALQFDIQEIAYDRWGAIFAADNLEEAGFDMVQFGQGFAAFASPTKEWDALIGDRRLLHGNHPVLSWMAGNVMVDQDAYGNLRPNKKASKSKIDGIVAGIMALDRAVRHLAHRPASLGDAPVSRTASVAAGPARRPAQLQGWD